MTRHTLYQPGTFDGQVVIVSGAGNGIGQAVSCLYGRLGAKLLICGADAIGLDACAQGLRNLGAPDVLVLPVSICENEQVEALMDAAWGHFGRVDVLVNIASERPAQSALECSVKSWKTVIDTDLNGTWYMMHAAARRWRASREPGNIVNIVGTFQRGMPGLAHRCAASAAVAYVSKTVAVEWAEYRVRVNCIASGVITNGGSPTTSPEVSAALARANPMKRAGDAEDVADAVVYLTAPTGEFVTGDVLTVDGGGTLWGETWATPKPDYYKVNT